MPRSRMTKIDVEARVLKLKNEIYDNSYNGCSNEWSTGAHYTLNRVLDILQEFRN